MPTLIKVEKLLHPLFNILPKPPKKILHTLTLYLPFVIACVGAISLLQGIVTFLFKVLRVLITSFEFLDLSLIVGAGSALCFGYLLIISYPYLRKNKVKGWYIVFGVTLAASILNAISNQSGIISTILFLYILFSIRPHFQS